MRRRRSSNRDDGAPTAPPARLRSLGVGRVDLALSRVKLLALDFPAVGGGGLTARPARGADLALGPSAQWDFPVGGREGALALRSNLSGVERLEQQGK